MRSRPAIPGSVSDPVEAEYEDYYQLEPEPERHLRDYWYLVLKRRWLVAAIAAGVFAVTALQALTRTPVFSATALLHISRGQMNVVQGIVSSEQFGSSAEFYPTQQRVLRSRTLAERLAEDLRLWERPMFGGNAEATPESREGVVDAVLSMLRVSRVSNTELLEVGFTTPNPQLSAELANGLVDQYVAFATETEGAEARNAESFLAEQIEKLQVSIQQNQRRMQDFSKEMDLVMVDEKETMITSQLEDLNSALIQAQTERASAEAQYTSVRRADPASLDEVQRDPNVQNLRREEAQLQKEIASLSSRFKNDWPELVRARESLADVQARLRVEAAKAAQEILGAARMRYQTALQRENLVRAEVESRKDEAQGLKGLTAEYNSVKLQLDNQQALLQQLLRRQAETGISVELGEREPVNVRRVESALVPKRPDGAGWQRALVFGALLGLSLGVGAALFLDYWDQNIFTVEDLRRHVRLPYLGMVPRYSSGNGEGVAGLLGSGLDLKRLPAMAGARGEDNPGRKDLSATRAMITHAKTSSRRRTPANMPSIVHERFKFIRGSLLMSTPGKAPKVILVTGADKNAGKTFVACNLASSLAALGKKVLLIDADLRNPQVHRVFRVRNRVGLSSILTGQINMADGCLFTSQVPNVYLLLAGPLSPSPAELLASQHMERVLEEASRHFDYVLLDSAPLLPVFDSHMLTARADANVFVLRCGQTSRSAVNSSIDLVERVGGKITGVVMNAVNLDDYAQNYYYSNYTYEYGSYPSPTISTSTSGH